MPWRQQYEGVFAAPVAQCFGFQLAGCLSSYQFPCVCCRSRAARQFAQIGFVADSFMIFSGVGCTDHSTAGLTAGLPPGVSSSENFNCFRRLAIWPRFHRYLARTYGLDRIKSNLIFKTPIARAIWRKRRRPFGRADVPHPGCCQACWDQRRCRGAGDTGSCFCSRARARTPGGFRGRQQVDARIFIAGFCGRPRGSGAVARSMNSV